MTTTLDQLNEINFSDVFRHSKRPSRKEGLYMEGYYDGAMDIFNALTKYLKERESDAG